MPLPEHQDPSLPQPEAKLENKLENKTEVKRSEWITVIQRTSQKDLLSHGDKNGHLHDSDDDELPPSIPTIGGRSSQASAPILALGSRSNSFLGRGSSFALSSSIPIPVSESTLSASPSNHSPPSISLSHTDSGSTNSSEHIHLSQDDDLSDSDDELPSSDPSFGLGPGIHGPPSADSDELPPVLSDDDDFPPPPTLIRQTGYYRPSHHHQSCTCLEPEERTQSDSYMYTS